MTEKHDEDFDAISNYLGSLGVFLITPPSFPRRPWFDRFTTLSRAEGESRSRWLIVQDARLRGHDMKESPTAPLIRKYI